MRSIFSLFRLRYKKKSDVKKVFSVQHINSPWQESVMHPSEILTYSVGSQCFLTSQEFLPALALSFLLWVLLHDEPLCPQQDFNPRFTPPILDILRGLPSGPSCEVPPLSSPFSEKPLFVRTVLVSTCRCIRENVRIYRAAERLKRHHHKNQKL